MHHYFSYHKHYLFYLFSHIELKEPEPSTEWLIFVTFFTMSITFFVSSVRRYHNIALTLGSDDMLMKIVW